MLDMGLSCFTTDSDKVEPGLFGSVARNGFFGSIGRATCDAVVCNETARRLIMS